MPTDDVAVGMLSSPFVNAYPWTHGVGFGAKYSNPGILPAGIGQAVAFSKDGRDLVVGHRVSPFVTAYPWTPGIGFGAKYANPGTLPPDVCQGLRFDTNAAALGLACINKAAIGSGSPWILAYPWTPGVGFGVKYGNPGTLPTVNTGTSLGASDVTFTPDGSSILLAYTSVAGLAQPFVSAWSWGPGFGAKATDPVLAGVSNISADALEVSPLGGSVAVAMSSASPVQHAVGFPFSGSFGAAYGAIVGAVGSAFGVDFLPDGSVVALAESSLDGVQAWPWGPGYGAKFGDAAGAPSTPTAADISADGDIMASATGSPFIRVWPFSGGFGAAYANPATLPGSAAFSGAFTPRASAPAPSPTQPDGCGPKNLTPTPLSVIAPEPVVKTYPHVTEITDWPAQQSIKLLWDRIHDHESRLRAGVANDDQWVGAANTTADAVKAAQLTADHALAQASAATTAVGGGTTGGGESGGDGGSPDDPEAGDGFNNRFATGHPPALPVPLTSYTVGQIVGGVANEFPALFANFPSDAETVAACQTYTLRCIWHLQQAGFVAGRQRNPSLVISNDKLTVFIDGTYRAYDIASLGGAGSPNVAHILRVSPADYVADAGTPD